jgi:predicted Na+-dependent transporter
VAKYFTLWVLLASIIAFWHPPAFSFVLPHISLCLGIIMFGMGMTLQIEDFKRVLIRPWPWLLCISRPWLPYLLPFSVSGITSAVHCWPAFGPAQQKINRANASKKSFLPVLP